MTRYSIAAAALATAFAWGLTACAGYGPEGLAPGATVAEAQRLMGTPTGEYTLPQGQRRLEYARGPAGKHTYMLDFDAQGRLVSSDQVLTEAHFEQIRYGQTQDEVLRQLGRPSQIQPLQWQRRQLWSYRYEAVFCVWFQVSFDTQGRVVDAGYGPDPLCEANDRDL